MDFSPEQREFLAAHLNAVIASTNKGKNEAWAGKESNLARTYLAMNVGARELGARIFEDDSITDPEQCPFLLI